MKSWEVIIKKNVLVTGPYSLQTRSEETETEIRELSEDYGLFQEYRDKILELDGGIIRINFYSK